LTERELTALTTLTIPERLQRLPELATDLWWTWNPQAREVFRKLDYPLWRQTAHNPVLMLQQVSQEMLNLAAAD
jgi:starch phosphorylase